MKYIFASLLNFLLISQLEAQVNGDPGAPYLKNNKIPPFSITSVNGKEVTNKQMPISLKTYFLFGIATAIWNQSRNLLPSTIW
jgi:hypothetical protein